MQTSLKLASLAIAATLAMGTAVNAQSYFQGMMQIDQDSTFTLDGITAEADGKVVFFDYHGGQRGAELGSINVREGANVNIRVGLIREPRGDVLAVLFTGDDTSGAGVANTIIEVDMLRNN